MRTPAGGTGVVFMMHLEQPLPLHMRVNFRRADVRMAQQHLNRAQVGSAGQQMGREGMPKSMWRDIAINARKLRVFSDVFPNPNSAQALARFVEKKPVALGV